MVVQTITEVHVCFTLGMLSNSLFGELYCH